MNIILDGDSVITPSILVREGKTWLELHDYATKKRGAIMPGVYCLFSALELHLKAYIVLKDTSYANPDKLRRLGHFFNRMYEAFPEGELKQRLKIELDRYSLCSLNIADLKYPQVRRAWHLDNGLLKGEHTLGSILTDIQGEIDSGMESWYEIVYPKEVLTSVALQGKWEEHPTKGQIEEWLLLCPGCRPDNILLSRQLNWPWCELEKKPIKEICKECGGAYRLSDSTSMVT